MTSYICKIFSFLILVCAHSFACTQGTWERVNIPTNQFLKSVCFVDSLYGWVAGDSGTMLHTTDGGATWIHQDTHADNEVVDVFFLNRNLGWASSFKYAATPYGTVLLKTTNGGASWQSQTYPTENIFITCILFLDSLNGWMGGKPHALVKTTNGGVIWTQAAIDTSTLAFFPVLGIQFYDGQHGYAYGGIFDIAGVIWHTSNGGDMWYAIDPAEAPADEVHGLHIFDSLHAMGAGGDPDFGYGVGMIHTSDGGLSWNYDELDIQGYASDLDFRDATEAWAPLGTKRKLIFSLDAGLTWSPVPTPDSTIIYDMTFPDSRHGFAVGKNGAFIKYLPPVIPSVTPVSFKPDNFFIYQNYPNPFTISTKIKYHVPLTGKYSTLLSQIPVGFIEIKIYSVLGNETATIKNIDISPGEHELEFKAENLPGGIYLYQLQLISAGKTIQLAPPKKFSLLK